MVFHMKLERANLMNGDIHVLIQYAVRAIQLILRNALTVMTRPYLQQLSSTTLIHQHVLESVQLDLSFQLMIFAYSAMPIVFNAQTLLITAHLATPLYRYF